MDELCARVRYRPDNETAAAAAAFVGDINARDARGAGVLQLAIIYEKQLTVAALAARRDCDPNCGPDTTFPLHYAACMPNAAVLDVLITAFPTLHLNARDLTGRSALHHAAAYGHNTHLKLLLDAGADPTMRTLHGQTPTDVACEYGCRLGADLLGAAEVWHVGVRAAWITACVVAVVDK